MQLSIGFMFSHNLVGNQWNLCTEAISYVEDGIPLQFSISLQPSVITTLLKWLIALTTRCQARKYESGWDGCSKHCAIVSLQKLRSSFYLNSAPYMQLHFWKDTNAHAIKLGSHWCSSNVNTVNPMYEKMKLSAKKFSKPKTWNGKGK